MLLLPVAGHAEQAPTKSVNLQYPAIGLCDNSISQCLQQQSSRSYCLCSTDQFVYAGLALRLQLAITNSLFVSTANDVRAGWYDSPPAAAASLACDA